MAEPALRVDGARELRASLKRAGISVQDLKDAHKEVAELVKREAQGPTAPRRSGVLAGSIRAAGTQSAAIVRAGSARVPYAGPIHFGWPARNIKAQPWISEAAESTEPQWAREYMDALETIINAVEGVAGR